jgi:hypothetical protein
MAVRLEEHPVFDLSFPGSARSASFRNSCLSPFALAIGLGPPGSRSTPAGRRVETSARATVAAATLS